MREKFREIREHLRGRLASIRVGFSKKRAENGLPHTRFTVVWGGLKRYWTVALGLVAAAIAFFATQQYAENQVNAARDRLLPRGGLVDVLVASRDLSVGERVTPVTVAVRQVPREWILPGTLTPKDFDAVSEQSFVTPVTAGNPLLSEHLRKPEGQKSDFHIEVGHRAVSISVDEVSSVGGLIQPGDFVDLWGSPLPKTSRKLDPMADLSVERGQQPQQARLIAENLRVLATGQNINRRQGAQGGISGAAANSINAAYSSITLSVPSKIANLVLGGQFQGRLGIALRSGSEQSAQSFTKKKSGRAKAVSSPPVEILIGGVDGGEE